MSEPDEITKAIRAAALIGMSLVVMSSRGVRYVPAAEWMRAPKPKPQEPPMSTDRVTGGADGE